MRTRKFHKPDGNFIYHPENEVEIFINNFFLHAIRKSSIDYDNRLDEELTERIRSHYRAVLLALCQYSKSRVPTR